MLGLSFVMLGLYGAYLSSRKDTISEGGMYGSAVLGTIGMLMFCWETGTYLVGVYNV